MKPCASEAMDEPNQNSQFHSSRCQPSALTRNSNATPRSISPISIATTARYSAPKITPYATGNATSSKPTPRGVSVSLSVAPIP